MCCKCSNVYVILNNLPNVIFLYKVHTCILYIIFLGMFCLHMNAYIFKVICRIIIHTVFTAA